MPDGQAQTQRRLEGDAFRLIGWFFIVQAVPVILGVLMYDHGMPLAVGLGAGILLLLLGGGGIALGRRFKAGPT